MEVTEDEIIQKYGKHCSHCRRNTLLPYEYGWTCFSSGFNVNKRKHELSKIQGKRLNFINRFKYAEVKIISICVDVYKNYEGDDYDKIYEVLSTLKNKKINLSNFLIEIYKNMLENHDFEQNHYSINSTGIYKIRQDIIRLVKWICYYDRSYYEDINYYNMVGSICISLNEISQR